MLIACAAIACGGDDGGSDGGVSDGGVNGGLDGAQSSGDTGTGGNGDSQIQVTVNGTAYTFAMVGVQVNAMNSLVSMTGGDDRHGVFAGWVGLTPGTYSCGADRNIKVGWSDQSGGPSGSTDAPPGGTCTIDVTEFGAAGGGIIRGTFSAMPMRNVTGQVTITNGSFAVKRP
jgi:hypothetical protein